MKHFETEWKSFDGLKMYAQDWRPDSAVPKAVICLVHGIGEHTSRYSNVAKALTDAGFAVMGADLRGHGRSGGKRGHFPSGETILNDIDLLLAEAHRIYEHIPVILYGNSLGGILVLYYTLKRRPHMTGVIATSAGLRNSVEKQVVTVATAKILGSIFPEISLPNGLNVNALSHDPNVIKEYLDDPLVHDRMTLGFGKTMLGVVKWTMDNAASFPLPLLLLHGTADSIAFSSGSTEFASHLKKDCKLVLLEDAFHELHNEPQKDQVFGTMTAWISEKIDVD